MRIVRLLPLGHRLRNPGELCGEVVGWAIVAAALWVML